MYQAQQYLYEIFTKFLDLIFEQCALYEGITLGWVLVAINLTGVMIKSIIALPKASGRVKLPKED